MAEASGAHRVSVILTTYNRDSLISDTITSILAQSFTDFELIVCDDHSTDGTIGTVTTLARADHRIRLLASESNVGMPRNLNRGILAAHGELIANLHDGDIYDHTLLEKWVAALDHCPGAAFVFNAYRDLGEWWEPGTIISLRLGSCAEGTELLRVFDRRWRFDSPVWGTVMVRRSAYRETGLLDEQYGFVADVDMWLRLAEKYQVAYVDEPLISLPPRRTVPRSFRLSDLAERRTAHAMMKASRIRRSSTRQAYLKHICVHIVYVTLDYAYLLVRTLLGRRIVTVVGRRLRGGD